jgi:mannose-6-phosphate isomerase
MSLKKQPYLLKNKIQHYAWGSENENAYIPRLLGIAPEMNKPYAELWMGVHPNAPSEAAADDHFILLDQLIKDYPIQTLGKPVARHFSNTLPFLFKVLSVRDALSIQVHPNKKQAKILHQKDPENYPDANHKPEIAIALDSLLTLVGFKPYPDLIDTFNKYPEIKQFIGEDHYLPFNKAKTNSEQKKQLKNSYSVLMKKSIVYPEILGIYVTQLENRLSQVNYPLNLTEKYFLKLKKEYPCDAGLFSLFLFNLIEIRAGEAIFLNAGIPHSYLKGNIVECMANSDNVVRAGLTPKFKDVETLTDILTYEMRSVTILGKNKHQTEIIYQTGVPEFQITRWRLTNGQELNKNTSDKPAIMLIIEGDIIFNWDDKNKNTYHKGQAIFIPAFLKQYQIMAQSDALIFKAAVP